MLLNQKAKQREKIHPTRIYLDRCSTHDRMYNEELLTYVREGNRWLFGHCNEGTTSTNNKGIYFFIACWINKERISNIVSILKIEDMGFRITFNR